MSKSRFAIGAVIGAVAGIVAGVLTAPKAGKETRADIKDKAAELKREAARKGDQVKAQSEDVIDGVREKIEGFNKDHHDEKHNTNKR
jgi:gas vesicle protein